MDSQNTSAGLPIDCVQTDNGSKYLTSIIFRWFTFTLKPPYT